MSSVTSHIMIKMTCHSQVNYGLVFGTLRPSHSHLNLHRMPVFRRLAFPVQPIMFCMTFESLKLITVVVVVADFRSRSMLTVSSCASCFRMTSHPLLLDAFPNTRHSTSPNSTNHSFAHCVNSHVRSPAPLHTNVCVLGQVAGALLADF